MRLMGQQRWCPQHLAPLLEGPDSETLEDGTMKGTPSCSWDAIRHCFRPQPLPSAAAAAALSNLSCGGAPARRRDLRLLLGVLGCPLAPVPLLDAPAAPFNIKAAPIETSSANYIIQQYLAATGCLKQRRKCVKNMYATGAVRMACSRAEAVGSGGGETGRFLVWQMSPGMWSLELSVAGNEVVAGSNGKVVWRHTPWLGTHAARGPQRPLRRIIQGLDPRSTAALFANSRCLGEKRVGGHDCFVLEVAADRAAVMERSEGPAEVIRHVLRGYFSQRSALLVHMADSHLARVRLPDGEAAYWETKAESGVGDYRDVDGVLIAHRGRTAATVVGFDGAAAAHRSCTRMEEVWTVDDAVFNVPGLSVDHFIPPADIFDPLHSST